MPEDPEPFPPSAYPPAGYPPTWYRSSAPGSADAGTPPPGGPSTFGPAPGASVSTGAPPAPGWPGAPTGVSPGVAVGAAESGQASPGRRALLTALVVLVVVALVGGGVAYLITSGPGPVPRISPAAQRLLRSSLAAAGKKGSFHYVLHSSSQGVSETTVGDAAPTSGKQVITIGPDTFTVLVIGRACYFQGDAREMVDQLGLSVATATAHAGQWISLAPSDAPYQSVYAAVTAHAALADNIDFAPHRRLPASVVSGHRVIGVSGPLTNFTVAGQTQKAKGTAYLYVAASKPHVPLEYTERGTIGGQKSTFTMAFGRWGVPVTVSAPPGATPFSSVGSGTTTPSGTPSLVST